MVSCTCSAQLDPPLLKYIVYAYFDRISCVDWCSYFIYILYFEQCVSFNLQNLKNRLHILILFLKIHISCKLNVKIRQICIGIVYKDVQRLLSHILDPISNYTWTRLSWKKLYQSIYRCAKCKSLCTKPLPLQEYCYQERKRYISGWREQSKTWSTAWKGVDK